MLRPSHAGLQACPPLSPAHSANLDKHEACQTLAIRDVQANGRPAASPYCAHRKQTVHFRRRMNARAGEGTRTLDIHDGNVVLCQLSYTRDVRPAGLSPCRPCDRVEIMGPRQRPSSQPAPPIGRFREFDRFGSPKRPSTTAFNHPGRVDIPANQWERVKHEIRNKSQVPRIPGLLPKVRWFLTLGVCACFGFLPLSRG